MNVLVHFFDEWSDFRVQEYNSLLELFGVPSSFYLRREPGDSGAFVCTRLPSEEVATEICRRAVLVKGIYELWGHGTSFDSMVVAVRQRHALGSSELPRLAPAGKSWCIGVSAYCRTLAQGHKDALRLSFQFIDFSGPVVLENPELFVGVLLDFSGRADSEEGLLQKGSELEQEGVEKVLSRLPPEPPVNSHPWPHPQVPCYCGRLLAKGGMRDELRKYDLKKRLYLGPTTLDHSLALIMANISGVKRGSMALDPFVGTASILIALSHFGAHCTGMDIDVRVLKGAMYAGSTRHQIDEGHDVEGAGGAGGERSVGPVPGPKRDIFETFRSYNLESPELLRMDIHLLDRHVTQTLASVFDVIVTDPPYGIRAGGRKSGKTNGCTYSIPAENRPDHIPSTQNYPVEEVMLDLLHAAARLLKLGGSLCYLIPTSFDFEVEDLPKHPCLALKRLCHQGLSTRHGRHMVLMHKISEYTEALAAEFDVYRKAVIAGECPDGFGKLLGKLELALASGGFENDAVVKIASKGAMRRKESAKARRTNSYAGPFNGRPRHKAKESLDAP